MPLFLGTTLMVLALVAIALCYRGSPGAMAALAGGVLPVFGIFAVTRAVNVPRDDVLAAADPAATQGTALWMRYLHGRTRWNHVRPRGVGMPHARVSSRQSRRGSGRAAVTHKTPTATSRSAA